MANHYPDTETMKISTEAASERTIAFELDVLDELLDRLRNTVDSLGSQIGPVLMPNIEATDPNPGHPEGPPCSSLRRHLAERNDMLRGMISTLNSMAYRVDL